MRTVDYLHGMFVLLILVALVACTGCQIRTGAQIAKEDEIKQQIANIAADIFEAAEAISNGADPAGPLVGIKVSAGSIISAQGRQYPPAEAFLRQMTQKMQPGTGPLPAGLAGRGNP
jgi:hypothetical protein